MYHLDLGASVAPSDDDFLRRFEDLTLPASAFRHADHVRLAWLYVRRDGLGGALDGLRVGIRRFATHHGAPGKYHETVTCAAVVLVHERVHRTSEATDWPAFAEANPDLLRWEGGAFFDHYPPSIVDQEDARHVFVLPTKKGVAASTGHARDYDPNRGPP